MKLEEIVVNNIELTPEIEKYLRARVQKLSKIVMNMKPASIRAEVGQPTSVHKRGEELFYAELRASLQAHEFLARKNAPNVYRAIENARHDIHQQIITWKKKQRSAQRKEGALIKRLLRSGK